MIMNDEQIHHARKTFLLELCPYLDILLYSHTAECISDTTCIRILVELTTDGINFVNAIHRFQSVV